MNGRLRWRIAVRDSELDAMSKLVALTLDIYMNARGIAWPSRATIADACGLNIRTVDRALGRLSQSGFIVVIRGRGQRPNLYAARQPSSDTDDTTNETVVATLETVVATLSTSSSDSDDTRSRKKPSIEAGTAHAHNRKSKPEPRSSAGAYRKQEGSPHKVAYDETMAAIAHAWLDTR